MEYIFIHGLGQTKSSWDKTVALLAPRDITCVNLANLIEADNSTYQDLYIAFEAYCDSFESPIHLCGLSLGGMLALEYTIKNPKNVLSLAVVGTQYKIPKLAFKTQSFAFQFMPLRVFDAIGFTKKDFMDLLSSMEDLDFSEYISGIQCKSLVVCGKKDKANAKASKELASCITHATLAVVDGSGHQVNEDNPKALYHELNYFYTNL